MGTIPKYDGELVIIRADEWSALYVDGELAKYGDHYLVDEFIQEALGVQWREGDHWLAPNGRDPLHTLAEVDEEDRRRADLKARAAALREQAHALEAEAELLNARAQAAAPESRMERATRKSRPVR